MARKRKAKQTKLWHFTCPNCGKATKVVTELIAVPCGGKWCRGLVNLQENEITEAEYNKAWGI
jgi:transcription elongation factor Elf1